MDGVLRKLTDRTWEGTLHGYRVQVFYAAGGWHFAVIDGLGHVKVGPRVTSLADGARRAREWVERRPRAAGASRWPAAPTTGRTTTGQGSALASLPQGRGRSRRMPT